MSWIRSSGFFVKPRGKAVERHMPSIFLCCRLSDKLSPTRASERHHAHGILESTDSQGVESLAEHPRCTGRCALSNARHSSASAS